MVTKMSFKNWLPLLGLTCAAFIFNTSEFIPIGLLSDIAEDFSTTEAHAGMLISVYSWVVMILSLPLMLLVSKIELRKLMLCTIVMFTVCQLLSSFSTTYSMLMASRIGVACTHAIFWSIVSPLAVSIVPDYSRPLALSMIVTGTSIAMIFG
ncbi:MAG: MFS transporter, partial [Bacteroides sp.]|nr:MFS transporter [Bacteroides sp.]